MRPSIGHGHIQFFDVFHAYGASRMALEPLVDTMAVEVMETW